MGFNIFPKSTVPGSQQFKKHICLWLLSLSLLLDIYSKELTLLVKISLDFGL